MRNDTLILKDTHGGKCWAQCWTQKSLINIPYLQKVCLFVKFLRRPQGTGRVIESCSFGMGRIGGSLRASRSGRLSLSCGRTGQKHVSRTGTVADGMCPHQGALIAPRWLQGRTVSLREGATWGAPGVLGIYLGYIGLPLADTGESQVCALWSVAPQRGLHEP